MVLFAALGTLLAPSRAGLAFALVLPTTEMTRIMKLICRRWLSAITFPLRPSCFPGEGERWVS